MIQSAADLWHFPNEQVLRRHTNLEWFSVTTVHLGRLHNEAMIQQLIKDLVNTWRGMCKGMGVKALRSQHLGSILRGGDITASL